MLESKVEDALKRLESWGFKCPKFKLPGTSGGMDRLILMPTWSPAPPALVEIKAPGKAPRKLQAAMADDWRKRGVDVREYCDTIEKVDALCERLLCEAMWRLSWRVRNKMPVHIQLAYSQALEKGLEP